LRPNSSARLCREQDQGFEGAGALRFAEDQVAVAAGDIGREMDLAAVVDGDAAGRREVEIGAVGADGVENGGGLGIDLPFAPRSLRRGPSGLGRLFSRRRAPSSSSRIKSGT